jgi:Tfp pilus assembly protein PilN
MKAINLLPNDLRGTPKGDSRKAKAAAATDEPGGIGAFVVLGALAVCVFALAAYVLTSNSVKDRQAQLDAATAQAETTAKRVSQLKPYADFQQMAETRIQTVKDLAASRFDWEQALRDISRAIPTDVTLSSLTGSISSDTTTGGSPIRSAIASPAIELKGCAKTQVQVAQLLSRLRSVDGVTRVSLSKSARADKSAETTAPATATVDGSTSSGVGDCGNGRPPQFELVIFFERSKVPSSVSDISVTPAAAAPASGAAAGSTATATGTTATNGGTSQPASGGVTTPPADPADSNGNGTATPASTPQGGGAQ